MKFLIALLVVVSCYVLLAQAGTSVCQQISEGSEVTANSTVRAVVTGVFANVTAKSSPLKKYFDGTWRGQSTDFTVAGSNQNRLYEHLVTFFYVALGCPNAQSFVNGVDGSTFSEVSNLVAAHENMGIGQKDFDLFNNVILGVMQGAGLTSEQLATVSGVLNSTGGACAAKSNVCLVITNSRESICDKYSDAQPTYTTNTALITSVVNGAVAKLVAAASTLKKFFDGTIPEQQIDYTTDQAALGVLAGKLVAFFGTALGCSDGDFTKYEEWPLNTSTTYYTVHQALEITETEFNQFNDDVIATLQDAGVSQADRTATRTVLDSLEALTVLQTTPTPTPTPTNGPVDAPSSLSCALGSASCVAQFGICSATAILDLGKLCATCWPEQIKCLIDLGNDCYTDLLKETCEAACPNSKAKCNSGSLVQINWIAFVLALLVLAMYFH